MESVGRNVEKEKKVYFFEKSRFDTLDLIFSLFIDLLYVYSREDLKNSRLKASYFRSLSHQNEECSLLEIVLFTLSL